AREQHWVAPDWGWAWPDNRRILYNRASAAPDGKPWSERKRYVWWDEEAQKWTGYDNPDFIADRPPAYRPILGAAGLDAISGVDPFILQIDGKGWLYAPAGLLDGPLPTHYEPEESVVENLLYRQQCNPRRLEWHTSSNPYHRAFADPRFSCVLTTYRVTEHHTAGGMSRWLSWLSELMPEMFCEVSPELAGKRGLVHGGWATISTARGDIECRVLVTRRLSPLRVRGRTVHQIGVPYHWGYTGRVRGDSSNDLLAGHLGSSTWRHVSFVERPVPLGGTLSSFSWLMMSDVCKHCARAGCLEACPTGAIVRTEFGSVYVQPDICNGCGYCVSACPFGVVDRRGDDGRAWKCTLCYDRLKADL